MALGAGRTLLILALALMACLSAAAEDASALLSPERVIDGLFTAPSAGAAPTMVHLMQPSSMAASGDLLFVFDRARGQLLRIDLAANQVRLLRNGGPLASWRLRSTLLNDVLLIAADRPEVQHLSADGALRQSFSNVDLTRPVDAAFDPLRQSILVADFDGRLHEFSLLGALHRTLDTLSERGATLRSIVRGPHSFFALDADCRCVIELDERGLPLRLIGENQVGLSDELAVDRSGRIWLLNVAGQELKVIQPDETVHTLRINPLGLTNALSLAVDQERLFLAEAGSGRIHVFSINPRDPGR